MCSSDLIVAIDPKDGTLKKWNGPEISAPDRKTAEAYLELSGLGYCRLIGELLLELDEEGNELHHQPICPN